jgi:glycine cleavage system H protein
VSELYAPASGNVTAINESLSTAPEQINQNANKAWMVKIELSKPDELGALLSAEDYEKYVAEEK